MSRLFFFIRLQGLVFFSFFPVGVWAFFLGHAQLCLVGGGFFFYFVRGSFSQLLGFFKVDKGLPAYFVLLF